MAEKKAARPAPKHAAAKKKNKTGSSRGGRKAQSQPRDVEAMRRHNQVVAIVLFAVSILLGCLVLIPGDVVWRWIHDFILGLFGFLSILWPILLCYISVMIALGRSAKPKAGFKMILIVAIMVLLCGTVYIFQFGDSQKGISFWTKLGSLYQSGTEARSAGLFSGLIGVPFVAVLGSVGAKVVSILLLFVAVMIFTGATLGQLFRTLARPPKAVVQKARERREAKEWEEQGQEVWVPPVSGGSDTRIDIPLSGKGPKAGRASREPTSQSQEKRERLEQAFQDIPDMPAQTPPAAPAEGVPLEEDWEVTIPKVPPRKPKTEEEEGSAAAAAAAFMEKARAAQQEPSPAPEPKPEQTEGEDAVLPEGLERALNAVEAGPPEETYQFPPVDLLKASEATNQEDVTRELQINGQMLVDTLKSFGVQAKILDISRGPAVTRYELQPAAGVKISKITNLADDIALNLAASGVRIEAPIPGKAAVGIEVPNKTVSVVRMRELVESNAFINAKSKLAVALGRDISGQVTVADLAKMPHLLIAGSTGSGKSVCINSLIVSLLYKATPDEVRFLMVDPKVVELGIYNGIPHLLVPVVTDPRKAAGALGWAVTEMLGRYKTFADNNVRDLKSYNALVGDGLTRDDGVTLSPMPQIVIIIDELADLMMAAPNEVEDSICRLAQMARAAGMHLVIATQRPSVDVITGIIKANIPSRIAFAVSSQVDSRTILDGSGAEKLLGRGDMLFSPIGSPKPIRVQGCLVEDHEIESIVRFVKQSQDAGYDQGVMEEIEKNAVAEKGSKADDGDEPGSSDPMIMEAVQCVVEAGQASTSLLQRRLRLGYARAGRLIDEMEQMGVVGPHEGSKPRQVLITHQQWLEMSMRKNDEKNSQE